MIKQRIKYLQVTEDEVSATDFNCTAYRLPATRGFKEKSMCVIKEKHVWFDRVLLTKEIKEQLTSNGVLVERGVVQ